MSCGCVCDKADHMIKLENDGGPDAHVEERSHALELLTLHRTLVRDDQWQLMRLINDLLLNPFG